MQGASRTRTGHVQSLSLFSGQTNVQTSAHLCFPFQKLIHYCYVSRILSKFTLKKVLLTRFLGNIVSVVWVSIDQSDDIHVAWESKNGMPQYKNAQTKEKEEDKQGDNETELPTAPSSARVGARGW